MGERAQAMIAGFCLRRPFLLLLIVAVSVRAQTYGNPVIEFDEQFYLVVGDRLLHGALPYIDIWDRKPLGLFLLFAAMRWLGGLFGGDGVLAVQLVATVFVAATARLIGLCAERLGAATRPGLIAGVGSIAWLNLLQGEGAQASVFYSTLVVAAALIMLDIVMDRPWTVRRLALSGSAAMLLIGLALQLKYTTVFEGALFGVGLIWAGWHRGVAVPRLLMLALLWITVALFPTLVAAAAYAVIGQWDAFLFANFTSGFLRAPVPLGGTLGHLASDVAIVALPLIGAVLGLRRWGGLARDRALILSWIGVSGVAILVIGTFSPHYFIPFLPPLMIAATPWFASARKAALALILVALVAGQGLVGYLIWSKGGRSEAKAMVAAIGPVPHCLYVHDGYPILYLLTKSCLPSRFIFPGHLNTATEAKALGIDSAAEVKRILASAPDAIVTDLPVFKQGNHLTQALVEAEIARHYRLVLRLRTGRARFRLVYRRR
jgi:hypothetical protein